MKTLKSSWNSDRIAAAICNRRSSKKKASRSPTLYARFNDEPNIVSVVIRRGREVFSRRFDDTVTFARVVGNDLQVETADGSRYVFDAWTGDLLTADIPTKPAAADLPPAARPEPATHGELPHAA